MNRGLAIRFVLILTLLCALWWLSACGDDDDDDGGDDDNDDASDDDDDDDDNDDDDNDDDTSPADPAQPGPFEVGNRTYVFVDASRNDPASQGPRTLVTEVWYPAPPEAADLPRDVLRNFFGEWDDFVLDQLEIEGATPDEIANFDRETGSARDAPLRESAFPYPLIVFSHGLSGVRFQNYIMAEYLASHGFLVVAPDHTGNALVAPLPEEPILFNENLIFISYWQRKADLSYLITTMIDLGQDDPDGFLTGAVDPEAVGAIGHSFGGTAAIETTRHDHRIKATVDMASFMFPWGADDFTASLMFLFGLEDNTMNEAIYLFKFDYMIALPPKFKGEFPDGGHYTFTDACILLPSLMGDADGCGEGERRRTGEPFDYIEHDLAWSILNPYITSFFGFNLRGEAHMADYLTENHASDHMNYAFDFGS